MEDLKASQNGNDILISQEGRDTGNVDSLRGSQIRLRSSYIIENNESFQNDFPLLIGMGFEEKMIKKVYIFLKPRTIEQAIQFMTEDNGLYQHNFYQSSHSNSQKCFICGAYERQHIGDSNDNVNLLRRDHTTPGGSSLLKRSILSSSSRSTMENKKRNEKTNIEQNDGNIESNGNIIDQNNTISDFSDVQ